MHLIDPNNSYKKLALFFIAGMVINTLIFFLPIPVYFLPDLFLLAYLIYKFKDLNQEISPIFYLGLLLLCGYYFLSPEPTDLEYQNKYIVTLKPFFYICILALYSKNIPKIPLFPLLKGILILYPVLLVWNIFLYFIKHQPSISRLIPESRPYFIFENNFEITFYISCFIAVVFIYRDKSLKNYFYLCIVILLANSRSGLLTFLVISPFYFWTLEGKKRWYAFLVSIIAAGFVAVSRNITQIAGNVDRLQTLNVMWQSYDSSFAEMLSRPFGNGIFAKVPTYLCVKVPDFVEWFVGNSNNCDPIMLQGFYTRALFQFGFYVTLLIPILFLLLIRRETNAKLAILIIAPIACVATSVGGFSNGLAFIGVLLCVYAYIQENQSKLVRAGA